MTDIIRSSDGAIGRPAYHGGDGYDQHQKHAVRVECECCGESFYMTDGTGHSG